MRYPYKLMELGYDYKALEPVITEKTMGYHHGKHMAGYTNNLNAALESRKDLHEKTLVEILSDKELLDSNSAIKNNGGGVYNHTLYFNSLKKGTKPSKYVVDVLSKTFESLDNFKAELKKACLTQFGSGWAYLVVDEKKNLKIVKNGNQETPLVNNLTPIMTIDVWEHAYYLDYQNLRGKYVDELLSIINWDFVEKQLKEVL